jgi:hypothetical protein
MQRSLTYFDDIYQNALHSSVDGISRPDSEVLRVPVNETTIRPVNETTIRLGKLLGLLPTSNGNVMAPPHLLSLGVGAFLAVADFNQRSSPFSDSLSELTEDCNFFMTMDFRDSALRPIVSGSEWLESFLFSDEKNYIRPMAVVGPLRSVCSDIVATMGSVVETKSVAEGEENHSSGSGGIPNISPGSTSARLDNTNEYPFFGRTIPTNAGEAIALCIYLDSINVRQLAILHVNDAYGNDVWFGVQNAARQFGISVSEVSYTDGLSLEEPLNAVSRLVDAGYKYFFGIFSAASVKEQLVMPLYDQGLMARPDLVWIFGETANEVFDLELSTSKKRDMQLAEALNGTGAILLKTPEREQDVFEQLLKDFQGDEALVEYYLSRHLSGFFVDEEPTLFRDIFAPTPSIYAMMAYDAVMALGIGACEIESDFFTGPELFESFKKVDFTGATGRVLFNTTTGTRDERYLSYQMYNFIAEADDAGEIVIITPYKSRLITLQNESIEVFREFVFFGGSTTPPPGQPLPTEDLNLVSDGVRSICWVLSGSVILLSFYCIVFTIRRRKTPTVRASQPIFLVLLCTGTFIMACSIIPATLQEPVSERGLDIACMLDIYLFSSGFSMTFAALFSKTWRINIVHASARKFRRVTIRTTDVLLPFAILMVLNMTILITWTILAPLQWQRVIVEEDMFGQPVKSRGTCILAVNNRENAEMIFLFSLGAVNVAALLFSNYQSYRARKLPSDFNETFYLAITNLVILEGLVLGAPILFVVGDDPTSFMLIRSLLVSIICFAVLLPMFVPKFTQAKDEKVKRHVANASSQADSNVAQFTSRASNFAFTDGVRTGETYGITTGGESIADIS